MQQFIFWRNLVNAEYVKSRLEYDPDTGIFRWKPIEVNRRQDKAWNTRYAGARAGCVGQRNHRVINLDGTVFYAQRLAWLMVHGEWPKGEILHLNGKTADNRLVNLRDVPHKVISNNRKNNTELPEDVIYNNRKDMFKALIWMGSKQKYLGQFKKVETAAWVVEEAKRIVAEGGGIDELTNLRKWMTESKR
jgi:hypothetical protein